MYVRPGELKFYDNHYLSENVEETMGQAELLSNGMCAPLVNSGPSGRVGRKIFVKSLEIGLKVFWQPLEVDVTTIPDQAVHLEAFRFLIVLDHQHNGADGTTKLDLDEILNKTGSAGLDVTPMLAWPNLENSARFTILHDKIITPPDSSVTQWGHQNSADTIFSPRVDKMVKIKKTFRSPLVINYKDSSASQLGRGSSSDIADNCIRVFAIRQHAGGTGTTTEIKCNVNSRLLYTD